MVTLSMIVKNEEKYLTECLQSVQGVVDEIVIVDTGSTDKTIEIAQRFDAKTYHFEWINDFAAARNFALEKSCGDWILYLDADERLNDKSKKIIKELTSCKKNEAYYCVIRNVDEKRNDKSLMIYPRLFPNKKYIRFTGAVHEQIDEALSENRIPITRTNIEILHLGYGIEKEGLQKKAFRNLEILKREYSKNESPYLAYHLAQTYAIMDDTENAVKYFKTVTEKKNLKKEYLSIAYRYLAVYNAEKRNWEEAIDLIRNSLQTDPEQPQALMVASKIFLILKNFDEADNFCRIAFRVNRKFAKEGESSSQVMLLEDKIILLHGISIAIESRNAEVFNYYYNLIKSDPAINFGSEELKFYDSLLNNQLKINCADNYIAAVDENNLPVIVNLLEQYSDKNTAVLILEKMYRRFSKNYPYLVSFAKILSSINRNDEAEKYFKEAFAIDQKDASVVFYLASIYLQKGSFDKLKNLIEEAERIYSSNLTVSAQLKTLSDKLSVYYK